MAPGQPTSLGDASAPAEGAGRPRRRGRTASLIGVAAVLGLVAGACGGILVQVGREPTKLPPLSQTALARSEGEAPKPLPAGQDRQVRTDGDLRDLLLEKPRGAEETDWLKDSDGWMDLAGYAGTFGDPQRGFEKLLRSEFRRAAVTGWEVDGAYSVEIRLIQYRQEEVVGAGGANASGQYFAGEGGTDDGGVPGTGDGRVYIDDQPLPGLEASSYPYLAEAHARRGDIAMEIWMSGAKRIEKEMITSLAERQMERL
ncbi:MULTISPECIES: hypothetical protein [unclassified Streptomyces]|uniref:hypothetical protein n=1 Tax=unclassified Streptomyces TaxID=2593676 RepID=UPI002442C6AA|nr:hypothetical protein [Streptomyces sp. DH41]MDG9725940.1 hypothetical protein [Streptomyces sp. DH41]